MGAAAPLSGAGATPDCCRCIPTAKLKALRLRVNSRFRAALPPHPTLGKAVQEAALRELGHAIHF